MMTPTLRLLSALTAAALLAACATSHERVLERSASLEPEGYLLVDAEANPLTLAELEARAAEVEVVYIGERHDQPAHHRLQADLAQELLERGPVVIAAEMFSWQDQPTLDRYNSGELDDAGFQAAIDWEANWGFPWAMYAPLFTLAERDDARLIGLNAPKGLSSVVFKLGADNLSPEDQARMPPRLDASNDDYRAFLAQALGGHMKDPPDPDDPAWQAKLDRFMQAQLVWDESMAHTLTAALDAAPEGTRFVVAAGAGHVRYGWGIPSRVQRDRPATRALRVVCISLPPDATPADLAQALDPAKADLFCVSRHQD